MGSFVLLQGWPDKQPDIIVSTPAALLNNIEPKRNRRVEFLRSVKYVVCFLLLRAVVLYSVMSPLRIEYLFHLAGV